MLHSLSLTVPTGNNKKRYAKNKTHSSCCWQLQFNSALSAMWYTKTHYSSNIRITGYGTGHNEDVQNELYRGAALMLIHTHTYIVRIPECRGSWNNWNILAGSKPASPKFSSGASGNTSHSPVYMSCIWWEYLKRRKHSNANAVKRCECECGKGIHFMCKLKLCTNLASWMS